MQPNDQTDTFGNTSVETFKG